MPLPDWIKQDEKDGEALTGRYVLDPDLYYPQALKEIEKAGIPEANARVKADAEERGVPVPELMQEYKGKLDQFWLEVAFNFLKLDAQAAIRLAGLHDRNVTPIFIVRGSEGYKERWALKNFKPGRHGDIASGGQDAAKAAAADARLIYRHVRG